MKKVISVFLVMIMLLSSFSISSNAYFYNDIINDYDEVIEEIRKSMVNRENEISFRYEGDPLGEIDFEDVFAAGVSMTSGDYLRLNVSSYSEPVFSEDGTVSMRASYYTTREQEETLEKYLFDREIGFDKQSLSGKGIAESISEIFNFICDNVSYDEEHYFDDSYTLKHTAYAAFFNKKAVCQGYALLFQLLAGKIGIESRIVLGYKGDELHAWNIVKLDDKWYQIDTTYGAAFEDRSDYFLKAELPGTVMSFEEGFTASEIESYAFSDIDYTESEHNFVLSSRWEATCTTDGVTYWHCSHCSRTEWVTTKKAYGHSFDNEKDDVCNACGEHRPIWTFNEETGTLTFSGSGQTDNIESIEEIRSKVRDIDMGEGDIIIMPFTFGRMENLETVDLGGVSEVLYEAFEACTSLKYITLSENLKKFDAEMNRDYSARLKSFLGFRGSSVNYYADEDGILWSKDNVLVFYPSGKPDEEYILGDRVITGISRGAFFDLQNLKVISLAAGKPDNDADSEINRNDANYNFIQAISIESCDKLEKLVLPDHLNLQSNSIYSCKNLKEIHIGSDTSVIGAPPCIYCEGIEKIVLDESNQNFYLDDFGVLYSPDNIILYPTGSEMKTYKVAPGVSKINRGIFIYCRNLEELELPESVSYIENEAFNAVPLKKLIIRNPDAVLQPSMLAMMSWGIVIDIYGYKGSTAEKYVAYQEIERWVFAEAREICPVCDACDAVETPAVRPTCYSVGYTKGLKCNNCSYCYSGHEEIGIVGHADDDIDRYCDFCGTSVMFDDRGKIGDNVFWRVFENGILWLYGSGKAYDDLPSPWSDYEDDFDIVYSEGVIENLSDSYFAGCDNIKYVFIPEGMTSVGSVGDCIAYRESSGAISFRNLSDGAMHFDIYDILNTASMFSITYNTVKVLNFNELVFERSEDGLPVTYNILRNGKRISEESFSLEDNKVLRNISLSISNYTFDEYLLADPDSFKKSVYLVMKSDDLLPDEMKGTAQTYTCETLLHFVEEPMVPDEPVTPDPPKKETFMDKFLGFINSIMNVFRKILKIFSKG